MDFKTIFALFSIILCLSSLLVVFLQNSVYSVVYLVLTFLASIIILLLLECEFFAFLFLIIYVGAIAVLFLFAIMMLDIKDLPTNKNNSLKYFIFGILVAVSFLILVLPALINLFKASFYDMILVNNIFVNWANEDIVTEIEALGQILYTHYVLQFLTAGFILFLAVIGVIILTVNLDTKITPTNIKQISRALRL